MCSHSFLREDVCQDCGIVIQNVPIARDWRSYPAQNGNKMGLEVLNLMRHSIDFDTSQIINSTLLDLCLKRKKVSKGKRRKSLILACLKKLRPDLLDHVHGQYSKDDVITTADIKGAEKLISQFSDGNIDREKSSNNVVEKERI